MRILCVEDNRDAREMVKIMLKNADPTWEVEAFENAAEALFADSKKPFDLYVLDIWMPGLDGLGLCRRLRERGRTQPIIFFSAMVQPHDREYILNAGADAFLVKPADLENFIPTVRRFLNSAAATDADKNTQKADGRSK
jgi:DNA-binding response OmpR family regulator